METYVYILTAAGGFAIGMGIAYLNSLISKKIIGSKSMVAIMGVNFARLAIDVLTLLAAYLICKAAGLPLFAALGAVAVGLSVCGMLFLKKLMKKFEADINADEKDGGE